MKFKVCMLWFILFTITFFSCKEKKTIEKNNIPTEDEIYLSKIDSILPSYINQNDFIIVYRYGSIQWTPYATIICIPKKDLGKEIINLDYFMCNLPMGNYNLKDKKPNFLMFKLNIDNPDTKVKTVDFFNLKKMSFIDFAEYTRNIYLTEHVGEGYCANFYLIKNGNSDFVYMFDKRHISKTSEYIKSIIRKISPMEYYQSLSLEEGCDTLTGLCGKLRMRKDLDTFNFAINHDREGLYW